MAWYRRLSSEPGQKSGCCPGARARSWEEEEEGLGEEREGHLLLPQFTTEGNLPRQEDGAYCGFNGVLCLGLRLLGEAGHRILVRPTTGLGPLIEADVENLTVHPMLLPGCEKLQDPTLGVGRRSLGSPRNCQELDQGSWPTQGLDVLEELRTE